MCTIESPNQQRSTIVSICRRILVYCVPRVFKIWRLLQCTTPEVAEWRSTTKWEVIWQEMTKFSWSSSSSALADVQHEKTALIRPKMHEKQFVKRCTFVTNRSVEWGFAYAFGKFSNSGVTMVSKIIFFAGRRRLVFDFDQSHLQHSQSQTFKLCFH